ncbi:MAG TPA: tetratricopeptide repeat protein [Micromonosporaceae bacterium]|nr:tetratricopeptide repeat protein [Micromonosporaceae bacterium]
MRSDDVDRSFGALLRAHRRATGLTQEALAERAALSGQAVGALERGDRRFPHRDTVARLAVALGLTAEARAAFVAAASRRAPPRPSAAEDTAAGGPGQAPPRQLPAAVAHFAGRALQIEAMSGLLGRSSTVVVSAISGMAGIGKTAFAVHWAYRVREQFPDGQLYVNLRGFDPAHPPVGSATAVRAFLEALGVPPERIPASAEAQVGLYRSLLADRRMLVVLDNARDAEQVRPLLPGAAGCLALVTSRNQLTSLVAADGAHLVTLDLLTAAEAHELLATRLGAGRVAAEPQAAEEIIIRCGRLPLALAIVAARAVAHPRFPLAVLAEELREARGSLDAFPGADAATDVRTVFSWSYDALSAEAARLFRFLGIHPGPDITAAAAASLADLPLRRLRVLLAELTGANLVVEHVPGRYTLHDLLRAYATEQAGVHEPEERHRAATHRMLDHYLHTAYAADRLVAPVRDSVTPVPPQPGTVPEILADHRQALDWFLAEHSVLRTLIDHAVAGGWDTHTWQLAWALTDFLSRRGLWHDDIAIQRAAATAARRLANLAAEARAHRLLAVDYTLLGSFDEAHAHLGQALDLAIRAEDPAAQAHAHNHFALLWERQDRYDRALHHAQQALVLYRATGHLGGQADALNAVGWSHAQLGEHGQALASCERALVLHQELGNRPGCAAALDSLGYAHHHLARYEEAIACYQRALALHRELGNRYYEAEVLTHLGETCAAIGRSDDARAAWQDALSLLMALNHADADQVRARLRRLDRP